MIDFIKDSGFLSKGFSILAKICVVIHFIVGQGAFHVVNPEDLRREIKSLLGVAAYGLLPWRGGATLFRFIWRKCC